MNSNWLREALSDLDPSCKKLTIHGAPALSDDDSDHSDSNAHDGRADSAHSHNGNGKRRRRDDEGDPDGEEVGDDSAIEAATRRANEMGREGGKKARQMQGTFRIEAVGNMGSTEVSCFFVGIDCEIEVPDECLCLIWV